jgi:hypothetical protein
MNKKEKEVVKTIPLVVDSTIEDNLIKMAQNKEKEEEENALQYPDISNIVEENVDKSFTNRDILDLFPDIGTAPKIIKAVILNGNISYITKTPLPPIVNEDVNMLIKEVLVDRYELDKELPFIIDELFEAGSASYLTIPSQELTKVTNSVTRTAKNKTFSSVYKKVDGEEKLSPYTKIGNEADLSSYLENYNTVFQSSSKKHLISITDSLDVFQMSKDLENNKVSKIHGGIKTSNESSEVFDEELDVMFKNIIEKVEHSPELSFSAGTETDNIGDRLHMNLNSDLVLYLINI